jgi:hypothetical protein
MVNMIPSTERRRQRRFIVYGRVRFVTGFDSGLGSLVNLGEGGILFRSRAPFPEGTTATFYVSPAGCPVEIEIEGQVVGVKDGLLAVRFLEERQEVSLCLRWLASENCPWTGTVSVEALGTSRLEAVTSQASEPAIAELETSRELVFQSA